MVPIIGEGGGAEISLWMSLETVRDCGGGDEEEPQQERRHWRRGFCAHPCVGVCGGGGVCGG